VIATYPPAPPVRSFVSCLRIMYAAALSAIKGCRFDRSEEKLVDVDGTESLGTRASFEMPTTSPRFVFERRSLKAV